MSNCTCDHYSASRDPLRWLSLRVLTDRSILKFTFVTQLHYRDSRSFFLWERYSHWVSILVLLLNVNEMRSYLFFFKFYPFVNRIFLFLLLTINSKRFIFFRVSLCISRQFRLLRFALEKYTSRAIYRDVIRTIFPPFLFSSLQRVPHAAESYAPQVQVLSKPECR